MPRKKIAPLQTWDGPVPAVAYIRCSSDRQARQESSLPAQRAEIARRAASDGSVVVKWFEDDGISGKNIEDRPGLQAAMEWIAAHKGQVGRMYVYDSKRMARNRAEAFEIRKDLHRARVQLIALAQPSVEDDAANAILESVWDGIAEAERLSLAKVVRRGQRQSLVDGWWPYPRPPFGFRSVGVENARGARRFKLLPDPATGEVVKRIFALYLAGDGSKNIASILDREGVPSPSRADKPKTLVDGWRAKHVKLILDNPVCWGAATWDGEVVNEIHHAPLVSRETWEEAQRLAGARRRTPSELSSLNTSKSDHGLFRPWLRCSGCGGTMHLNRGGQPENRVWYYACYTRSQNNASCNGLTVRADELDAALLEVVEREVLTPERIRGIIEDALQRMRDDAGGELRERRAVLEARVKELSTRLQRLAAAIADGSMELEDVSALSAPLRRQREDARAELAALPEPQPVPTVDEVDPELFRETVTARWRSGDITVQRKALDRIITEIRLEPGTATIRYSWKVEPSSYTYQEPAGPPEGSGPIRRGWARCAEVSPPGRAAVPRLSDHAPAAVA